MSQQKGFFGQLLDRLSNMITSLIAYLVLLGLNAWAILSVAFVIARNQHAELSLTTVAILLVFAAVACIGEMMMDKI